MALTKIDDRGLKTPIDLLDNEKIRFGTGNDTSIFFDGTRTTINTGSDTGNELRLLTSAAIRLGKRTDDTAVHSENMLRALSDGAVELYYDGSKKLETTSAGVSIPTNNDLRFVSGTWTGEVAGKIQQSGNMLYIQAGSGGIQFRSHNGSGWGGWNISGSDGHLTPANNNLMDIGSASNRVKDLYISNDIDIKDSGKLLLGDGDDLQIYHDGSHSYINNSTGNLNIYGDVIQLRSSGDEYYLKGTANSSVELYYDNSKKLETASYGAITTGTHKVQGVEGGHAELWLQADEGDDDADNWLIYHDASDNKLKFASKPGGSYTDKLIINSSGIIGVNTTSPTVGYGGDTGIHIHSSATSGTRGSTLHLTSGTTGTTAGDGSKIHQSDNDLAITNYENARLDLGTNGTHRLTIKGDGNIGINRDAPACKLEVSDTTGSISATKVLCAEFRRDDGTRNPRLQIQHNQDGTFLNHTYSTSAPNLMFGVGGTERLRISSDGNVKVNNGHLVIGTGGYGIDFSAIGNAAGMTSELFDAYEEGTWTPTAAQGTFNVSTAHYVRIGSVVYIQAYGTFDSNSSGNDQNITGLPFNSSNGSDYGTVAVNSNANLGYNLVGQIDQGTPHIIFAKPDNSKVTGANMSGKFALFSGTYHIH